MLAMSTILVNAVGARTGGAVTHLSSVLPRLAARSGDRFIAYVTCARPGALVACARGVDAGVSCARTVGSPPRRVKDVGELVAALKKKGLV